MALAVVQFVEVPLANGSPVRVYSTDITADGPARAGMARALLGFSRLGVLMVGELPAHALTAQLSPLHDHLLRSPWPNRDLLMAGLPAAGLDRLTPAQGAFYIYARVGHLTDDSLAFCEELLRATGVATAPGLDFDPVEGRRFIRMSFAVSTPEIEEALRRLTPWFQTRAAERRALEAAT